MSLNQNLKESVKKAQAIIFASGDGISLQKLMEVLEIDKKQMKYIIDEIKEVYNEENSGIVLMQSGDVYAFVSNIIAAQEIKQALSVKKNTPLSNAAMETLAIIAYNQPISRAFIEQVRGVDSTSSVNTLITRGLIEEAGRLDIPGRPISYKTTPVFLRSFSLNSLENLPQITKAVIKEAENDNQGQEDDEYNL